MFYRAYFIIAKYVVNLSIIAVSYFMGGKKKLFYIQTSVPCPKYWNHPSVLSEGAHHK